MVSRPVNGVRLPVEARLDDIERALAEARRFDETQAEINVRVAEHCAESKEHSGRLARDVEALRMYAAGGWRTRLLARRLLTRLETEGKAVAAPPRLAQEMAIYADEDRSRVEFAAWVVLASAVCGFVIVAGLFAWWCLHA